MGLIGKSLKIFFIGASAYFVWDGAFSRELDNSAKEIQAVAQLTTMGNVIIPNLAGAPQGSNWQSKLFTVEINNNSDRILRGMYVEFYLKSKGNSDLRVAGDCLIHAKVTFRILSGAHGEQCVVFLTKQAAELVESPDFGGWSSSIKLYGHSQPIKILASLSSWFAHVNE